MTDAPAVRDLKVLRAVVHAIAETGGDLQTRSEADALDAYLTERIVQLDRAAEEAKAAGPPMARRIWREGRWREA